MTSHHRPVYPTALQVQISHSARFARALRTLELEMPELAPDLAVTARDGEDDAADDGAALWLEGRAEEIEVFTADVLRAWSAGELELTAAVQVIRDYVHSLHAALEGWFGYTYAPSCCGPLAEIPASGVLKVEAPARRADPLLDTAADAPPAGAGDPLAADRAAALAYGNGHAMASSRGPVPRPARVG